MRIWSKLLAIRKCSLKSQLYYHYISRRTARIKYSNNIKKPAVMTHVYNHNYLADGGRRIASLRSVNEILSQKQDANKRPWFSPQNQY
jgi:hypothetical protein